jgi:hypothetical protein
MVQHFLPDLRAETPASDGSSAARSEPAWLPVSLAERWRLIERLLSYMWRGQARAEFAGNPHEAQIYDGQGQAVCRLTSEKRLDFFLLSPREAIGCTEVWHHARGLAAALNVPGNAPCFGHIREQHRRLQTALDAVELSRVGDRSLPPPPSAASAGEPVDLTRKQQVRSSAARIRDLLNEFRGYVVPAGPSAPERARHLDTLLQVADSPAALMAWFQAVRYLTAADLPRLPPHRPGDSPGGTNILDLVCVAADRPEGRRSHVYEVEIEFFKQPVNDVQRPEECQTVQLRVLTRLIDLFGRSLEHRSQIGSEAWEKELEANTWRQAIEERLRAAVERFVEVHRRLATQSDERRGEFRYETLARLMEARSALAGPPGGATSKQRWEDLFAWSQRIIGVTTEHLESRLADDGKPLAEKKLVRQFKDQLGTHVKSLDTIYGLRNRQAHEYKPEYWKDWQALQSDVASRLGKRFERQDGRAAPTLFTSTTLDLTAEEATQVRLALLSDFTDGLSELERKKTGSA